MSAYSDLDGPGSFDISGRDRPDTRSGISDDITSVERVLHAPPTVQQIIDQPGQPGVLAVVGTSVELKWGQRRVLPTRRESCCQKARVGGQTIYVTYSLFPDGSVAEVFIDAAKTGSSMRALFDAYATAISIGLQYGVPLEVFARAVANTPFEPKGAVEFCDGIESAESPLAFVVTFLNRLNPCPGKT